VILRLTKQPWHNFLLAFWGAVDWKYQHLGSNDSWLDVLSDVSQIGRSTLENIAKGIWMTNFKMLKTEKGFSEFLRQDMITGVAQGCNCHSILDTIATLIDAQRPDLAMVLIEEELNTQT